MMNVSCTVACRRILFYWENVLLIKVGCRLLIVNKYVSCKVLLYFFLDYKVDGSVGTYFQKHNCLVLLEMQCKTNSQGVTKKAGVNKKYVMDRYYAYSIHDFLCILEGVGITAKRKICRSNFKYIFFNHNHLLLYGSMIAPEVAMYTLYLI